MKLAKYAKKPYLIGLGSFVVVAIIGAVTIPLFFFTLYEKWGTKDSLFEFKFIGYYVTVVAFLYIFIKGFTATKSKSRYVFGFLSIPIAVLLFGFVWFRFIYPPVYDSNEYAVKYPTTK